MNEWKDFEKILAKTANWNQEVIERAHSDFNQKEVLLNDKIKSLELHLGQSEEKIVSLAQKIQHLVSNYAAFEPVLELKNRLTKKVEDLEKEKICMNENYQAKEKDYQELIETTIKTYEEKLRELQISSKEKLETKEAEWKTTIEAERDRIKTLETTLSNVNKEHDVFTAASKRQHHEELEKLRGQILHLQRTLSSKNMTNLDVFASKLQSAKEEFEQSLKDKNDEIRELKMKLKSTEDNNRYLNMVAVVRNVPEEQSKQVSDCSTYQCSKRPTESELFSKTIEDNSTKKNIADSEAQKGKRNENILWKDPSYNKCDSLSNNKLTKLSKKRKLFSTSSVLL